MTRSDLAAHARQFAEQLQNTINRTVADDAIVRAGQKSEFFVIGTCLGRDLKTTPVPLRSTSDRYRCWLDIKAQVFMNEEGFLTVHKSMYSIRDDPDQKDPLFHYDFERGKADFAEAHLQVFAENARLRPMMDVLCTKRGKKALADLHLPVGGRRFRPTLEDLIEFLIDEQLADEKPGARDCIAAGRRQFWATQLGASVRDNPDIAVAALERLGYTVTPPKKPRGIRRLGKRRST